MMNINEKLLKEINSYCKLNNIEDVDSLINKMLKVGFDIEKFGPNLSLNKPKVKKEEIKVVPKENNSKEEKEEDLYGE